MVDRSGRPGGVGERPRPHPGRGVHGLRQLRVRSGHHRRPVHHGGAEHRARSPQRSGLDDPDRHLVRARRRAAAGHHTGWRHAPSRTPTAASPGRSGRRRSPRPSAGSAAGELEKVVLARDLLARASEPIDPRWIVARLAEQYERCWTYLVDGLVGATPEMLLRRENGLVTSRVLAGTIQRSGRQHPRSGVGGGAGPVQQGPGGARVRGGLGGGRAGARTAPG